MSRLFLPQSQIGNEQVSLRVLLDDARDRWHADYLFRSGSEPEQWYFGCRSSLTRKRAATGSAEIEHLFWNINRAIAPDCCSIARREIHVDLHPEMIFWSVGEGEVIQVRREKSNLRARWVRQRIDSIISVGVPLLSIL